VSARDAAGNVDPASATFEWTVEPPPDVTPPDVVLTSGPPASGSTSTSATFAFTVNEPGSTTTCAVDAAAPAPCTSPVEVTGLTPGPHQMRIVATDAAGNADPTPVVHSWTIDAPPACSAPGTVVSASADSWIQQKDPGKNNGTDSMLKVTSKQNENTRALVRFNLPATPANCQITAAELRLHNASGSPGRTYQVLRVTGSWTESGVTWANQPATAGNPATATTPSGAGQMKWDVLAQVQAMAEGGNNGFLIRDSLEGGPGIEQQLHAREKAPDQPPQLVITYG
jgi:hypothetical protein